MDLTVWLALLALFFAGGLTPGPAVMMVMSTSLRYGAGTARTKQTGPPTCQFPKGAIAAISGPLAGSKLSPCLLSGGRMLPK